MIRNQMDKERGLPVMTVFTMLWCVGVFLMLNLQPQTPLSMARWGYFPDSGIYEGKYWALITSAFVHLEPLHLFFNMYWLWILGGAFERMVGPVRWITFVIAAAFVSSGLQMLSGGGGIGFSGVGYAIFGFAWMTRTQYAEFTRIVTQRTVQMFVGWAVLCIFATYTGMMHVANTAHFGGLAFGVVVGALYTVPKQRILLGLSLIGLLFGATLPMFWSPLSEDWVAVKATEAEEKHDYVRAEALFMRYLDIGYDKRWAWYNLATIYGTTGRKDAFAGAIEELKVIKPEDANYLREVFESESSDKLEKKADGKTPKSD